MLRATHDALMPRRATASPSDTLLPAEAAYRTWSAGLTGFVNVDLSRLQVVESGALVTGTVRLDLLQAAHAPQRGTMPGRTAEETAAIRDVRGGHRSADVSVDLRQGSQGWTVVRLEVEPYGLGAYDAPVITRHGPVLVVSEASSTRHARSIARTVQRTERSVVRRHPQIATAGPTTVFLLENQGQARDVGFDAQPPTYASGWVSDEGDMFLPLDESWDADALHSTAVHETVHVALSAHDGIPPLLEEGFADFVEANIDLRDHGWSTYSWFPEAAMPSGLTRTLLDPDTEHTFYRGLGETRSRNYNYGYSIARWVIATQGVRAFDRLLQDSANFGGIDGVAALGLTPEQLQRRVTTWSRRNEKQSRQLVRY
jgi:hypothetical protein